MDDASAAQTDAAVATKGPPTNISGPVVLASGQRAPLGLAVDAENVYWMNRGQNNTTDSKVPVASTGGQVLRCAIRGCGDQPTVLAADRQVGPGRASPAPLVTDGQNVYWSDETPAADGIEIGGLFQCSVSGCGGAPKNIGPDVWGLALHAGRVYWTEFEARVSSCAVSGCDHSLTSLWSAGFSPVATGIAVDDSGVYWATRATDSIQRCALDGCDNNPTVLDPGDTISASLGQIALDSKNVYFADSNPAHVGMILMCPKSGCTGTPTVLADKLSAPNSIATDGVNVYWAETGDTFVDGKPVSNAGSVRKCAVTGCANLPTTIATANAPMGIAVDAWFVYWTAQGDSADDGRIMMAPK